jgi:hypothetical protein
MYQHRSDAWGESDGSLKPQNYDDDEWLEEVSSMNLNYPDIHITFVLTSTFTFSEPNGFFDFLLKPKSNHEPRFCVTRIPITYEDSVPFELLFAALNDNGR